MCAKTSAGISLLILSLFTSDVSGQTVVAWGANSAGQSTVPADATNVIAVAAGRTHSLALRKDGSMLSWGSIKTVPVSATNVIQIAADGRNFALRQNGMVFLWDSYVAAEPPSVTNAIAVAAGAFKGYALTADGKVFSVEPNRVAQVESNAIAISAQSGPSYDYLLVTDRSGVGSVYEIGLTTVKKLTQLFSPDAGLAHVSAGSWQHLGITAGGDLWSRPGAVYTGSFLPQDASNYVAVSTHNNYSLGLKTDGTLKAWGTSSLLNAYVPLTNVTAFSAGPLHALAVVADGAPALCGPPAYATSAFLRERFPTWARAAGTLPMSYSWYLNGSLVAEADTAMPDLRSLMPGANTVQVVISNSLGAVTSGVQVVNVRPAWVYGSYLYGQRAIPAQADGVRSFAGGGYHHLSLGNDGKVIGWGKNLFGQISPPEAATNVSQIAAGSEHSLALRRDGTLVSWGSNTKGQSKAAIEGRRYVAVSAGAGHTLALREDGSMDAWGDRISGQADIALLGKDVTAIACGYWHNIALRTDGSVLTAGLDYPVPASVSNIVAVAAGWESCLALRADGTVIAWGNNFYGQCDVPASATNLVSISGGAFHYAGVRQDGTVVAWGREYRGTTRIPDYVRAWNGVTCGEEVTIVDDSSVAPEIGLNVGTAAVTEGSPLIIPVRFAGSGPLTFQWSHNGAPIAGATNRFLLIPKVTQAHNGQYSVSIANALGEASGDVTSVQVKVSGGQPHSIAAWQNSSDARPVIASDGAVPTCAMAAGGYHMLTLDVEGRVHGSGKNSDGQLNIPASATNIVAIAAGGDHSLALTENGTVLAWGRNWDGQCDVPSSATNITTITAGWAHSLALRADGAVLVWGNAEYGQTYVSPLAVDVQAIAAGWYHSMALRNDGRVAVWGLDTPLPESAVNVIAIAAGREHCLALRRDGTVVAWGDNTFGQCDVPPGASNVVAISAGYWRSTALRADGTLISWGIDQARGVQAPANLPGIANLSAGEEFDSAFRPATGQPRFGRMLKNVYAGPGAMPRVVVNVSGSQPIYYQWYLNGEAIAGATNRWLDINTWSSGFTGTYSVVASNAFGDANSGALNVVPGTSSGSAVVAGWGSDGSGQLRVPAGLNDVSGISAGAFHCLALKPDGTITAWGKNSDAQLSIPESATNIAQVAAGGDHSLALTRSGSIIAWGGDWDGQTSVPAEATNVVHIAAGFAHSLALTADGRVLAWGNNDLGQTNVPWFPADVVSIAAGYYHNLALLADGSLVVWGLMDRLPAAPIVKPVAISGGWWHSLVLQEDGKVVAWGDNSYGQCNVPAEATNVVAISAGYFASYALRADGTLVAWGARHYNLSTVPPGLRDVAAVSAGEDYVVVIAGSKEPSLASPLVAGVYSVGEDATLTAEVIGTPPLKYQWYRNGQVIAGATQHKLALTNLQVLSSGSYELVVSNRLGQSKTFSTTVSVSAAPEVVPLLAAPPVSLGGTIRLAPRVYGDPAGMQYSWLFNGLPLQDSSRVTGAHSAVLSITNAVYADTGAYSLEVRNQHGSTTRLVARLDVVAVIGFGGNLAGQITIPTEARDIVAVAAGGEHSLALKYDGTVLSWGGAYPGRNAISSEATNIVAIADSPDYSLALTADGKVVGWGTATSFNLAAVPASATNVVRIALDGYVAGAVKADGTIVSWGLANYPEPTTTNAVDIAYCQKGWVALLASGDLVASGPIGKGPAEATNIIRIATGFGHAVALRKDGTVLAWGDNSYGQCSVPGGLMGVTDVQAGDFFSVALLGDGRVVTWGGSYFDPVPVPDWVTGVKEIRAGSEHCIGLVARAERAFELASTVRGNGRLFLAGQGGGFGSSYQWYHNGTALSGATNHFLSIPGALWKDRGSYVLAATNALGAVSYQKVNVTIEHAPLQLTVTSQGVPPQLQVTGLIESGPVILEASTDLLSWGPILTNAPAAGTMVLQDPQPVSASPRFYRVREVEQ